MAEVDIDGVTETNLAILNHLRSPIWLLDVQPLQIGWANRAALNLWQIQDLTELNNPKFDSIVHSLLSKVQKHLKVLELGQSITEPWAFYLNGQTLSVPCLFSSLRLDDGRLLILAEGTVAQPLADPQMQSDKLLWTMTRRIRQSLNLFDILNTAVAEVRQFLKADRVLIYQFQPNWTGVVLVESISPACSTMLGYILYDPCFGVELQTAYCQRRISAIADVNATELTPCYLALLETFQVRANLTVPILQNNQLWGLLIVHQCNAPRYWLSWEKSLLQQLSEPIEVAIQQAGLYERVQQLNANLEDVVQQRTAQLQQALDFEALLKRIIDRVRDSLDEGHILKTAVEELATELKVDACGAAVYDLEAEVATMRYGFVRVEKMPDVQETVVRMDQMPAVHEQILRGQYVHFCPISRPAMPSSSIDYQFAILACPLMDDTGVVGSLWLFRVQQDFFSDIEVRLGQQVASQCAIALRQSRLYQAAQTQVRELERLNQLKDDFLSTISHELRTPMSGINLATQMLEVLFEQALSTPQPAIHAPRPTPQIEHYLQMLKDECHQETTLINDLLSLTRLDAEIEPLLLTEIDLGVLISHIAEPFNEKTHKHQQQLAITIPPDLPPLTTDVTFLERVLTELLNNACKYTPAGEQIIVAVKVIEAGQQPTTALKGIEKISVLKALPPLEESANSLYTSDFNRKTNQIQHPLRSFQISITNTGVEIPASERDRIFDKFYRIPNNDPWKYGGTGLGLALVRKLVTLLGGTIQVEPRSHETTFILSLPLPVTGVIAYAVEGPSANPSDKHCP